MAWWPWKTKAQPVAAAEPQRPSVNYNRMSDADLIAAAVAEGGWNPTRNLVPGRLYESSPICQALSYRRHLTKIVEDSKSLGGPALYALGELAHAIEQSEVYQSQLSDEQRSKLAERNELIGKVAKSPWQSDGDGGYLATVLEIRVPDAEGFTENQTIRDKLAAWGVLERTDDLNVLRAAHPLLIEAIDLAQNTGKRHRIRVSSATSPNLSSMQPGQ